MPPTAALSNATTGECDLQAAKDNELAATVAAKDQELAATIVAKDEELAAIVAAKDKELAKYKELLDKRGSKRSGGCCGSRP